MTPGRADALLTELIDTEPWEHRAIVVFGREIMQPRLISWAGQLAYKYSGQTLEPRELSPTLAGLCHEVSAATGTHFNHLLLNRYRDGQDHIGYHADNEPELGRDPLIASLSLGARRRFLLKRKDHRRSKRLSLEHGSLLVMGGTLQHTWRHAVPKMARCEEERINITFRRLMGPPGWRAGPQRPQSG